MPVSRVPFLQSKWAVALSALLLGSVAAPALGRMLRPVFRNAVKGGILLQRHLNELVASLREDVEDVVAEAKAELATTEAAAEPHQSTHHQHGTA